MKKIHYLLCIIITICAVAQVGILNRHSTSGEELSQIMSQISVISQQNENLHQQIASASSLTTIADHTLSLGLDTPVQTLALTPVSPLAVANNMSL